MKISIIVCTFNRASVLTPCLDSIVQSLSTAAPVEAEIVVIDNASTDDTSAVIKRWAETSPFPVQVVYEPEKGLSAARNCAFRAARGDLLVFTDDDCRLSKEYVAEALRHDAADTDMVFRSGRVELGDPSDMSLTIQTSPARARWQRPASGGRYVPPRCGSILGCNMTMRRTLVDRIGFFDENLGAGTPFPAEDIDYAFRVLHAGMAVEYVPDMTIFHFHGRKSTAESRKLLESYAIGEGALYAKFLFIEPQLCRHFYWDFKNMMRDIIACKNSYPPDFGFSFKDKIIFNLRGALMYWIMGKSRE